MNNNPHDQWDKLFEQLPLDTTAREAHREHLKRRVLDAFENGPSPRSQLVSLQAIGQTLMKYKAPYWTAAAILVACSFWLFQPSSTPAFALSELVENILSARTVSFNMTATPQGQPSQKMKAFFLEPNHFRQELTNGYINICDFDAGKMVGLDPTTKKATLINLKKIPEGTNGGMGSNMFEVVRNWVRHAQSDPNTKVDSLGEKQINGNKVPCFRFKKPGNVLTVWADPETHFPIRIESTMVGPPKTDVVMTDYEFNLELDESLFSLEIPEGYEVKELNVDGSPTNENDFITALRMCCESSNDEFPAGLDQKTIQKCMINYLGPNFDKEKGPTSEQMQKVIQMGRGFQFVLVLPAESDAHYAGAGVTRGDANRAIFWYKLAGAEKYRVLYADLEVKESDLAPDVEGAVKLK